MRRYTILSSCLTLLSLSLEFDTYLPLEVNVKSYVYGTILTDL